MRLPFTREEFYDPEKAVRRLGLEDALDIYVAEVEPLYTFHGLPRLPKDWQWRKLYVHTKARGRCAECRSRVPKNVDPHHKITRGEGGDHSLDNLVLLCLKCHREQHPEYSHKHAY
jgi:5-methylcytosine-specific restriction endonuclease McrA